MTSTAGMKAHQAKLISTGNGRAPNNLNSESISTPVPRQLYIEYLISQNRNTVISYSIGGVAVTPGGSVNLQVGSTYDIVLNAATATQGYNQL